MSFLDIITKWTGLAGPVLLGWLEKAKEASPDAAAKIDEFVVLLTTTLSLENIASKVGVILSEGANVARGKFDGRSHSGDVA
jgi:hypothetical protein